MANALGGLNYDAELSAQDYRAYRDLLEQEVLKRFLLSTGYPPNQAAQTGIVDLLDPGQVSSADTTRPLLVRLSDLNVLHVQVNPGMAVTPNGALIDFAGDSDFELTRTLANDINVLFVENELIVSGSNPVNSYGENLYTREIQNPLVLRSALLADFNNAALYPATRKANIVVLAVCTVVATADSSLELQIDMGRSLYNFIRPWFSIKDVQHRSMVGSGVVTDQNPHGTSWNELTVPGTVGLFQGLADTGIVVSRDKHINKMSGAAFCTELIPLNRVKSDQFGLVTAKSKYGAVGAQYVELLTFPARLGSLFETATPANSISGEVIDGTNILVFGPQEDITEPLSVEYTEARALVPPVNVSSNLLVFKQPDDQEAAVSGGLIIDQIPNNSIDLDGTGPYPRRYKIYLLSDRSLASFPQILVPSIRLDNVGTGLYEPPREMIAPARIGIGLTKATNISGMELEIEVTGLNELGTLLTETVVISNAGGYSDESVPSTNYDSPNQIYLTSNVFGKVETIQVTTRANDGPLSEIQVWAECEPGTAPQLNDVMAITTVGWNGQGIADIKDSRLVSRGFFKPDYFQIQALGDTALTAARLTSNLTNPALLSGGSIHLMTEDFEDLHYFDTHKGLNEFVPATGIITVGNNSLIQAGDSIEIRPGKVMVATTGAADATLGQWQIGVLASTTIQNIIAAINNSTFASGAFAETGAGQNIDVTNTLNLGASGNAVQMSRTVAASSSIQISGFSGGFDRYGECYLDRNQIGLKSKNIPDNSDLYAYGYQYRTRFRSRAIALPTGISGRSKFAVVVHGQDLAYGVSIRIRGSDETLPGQWLGWQVMTPASPGLGSVYIATLTANCHKVQVEVYGKARGISLFNIVPNP